MATEVLALLLASLAQAETPPPPIDWLTCSSLRTPEGRITFVDQFVHVYFESGSARIDEEGGSTLDRYAANVQPPPSCHVIIAGHTDTVGSSRANLELSRRRAEAVDAHLRARGVTGPITIRFFGEARPMVETSEGAPEADNRRVEVYVGDPSTP